MTLMPLRPLMPLRRQLILVWAGLLLAGCAAGTADENREETVKVGMHIDALLEFAIEYPLDWTKQRRLYRAEDRGEVVWTVPGQEDVRLQVTSRPLADAGGDRDARLNFLLRELPGFELTLREKKTLPGGDALHVMGYTSRLNYDLLLFDSPDRAFTIRFSAPPATIGRFRDVFEEITRSFVPLESADERS